MRRHSDTQIAKYKLTRAEQAIARIRRNYEKDLLEAQDRKAKCEQELKAVLRKKELEGSN